MKRITKGHLIPFWKNDFVQFDYVKQPLLDDEIEKWKNEGFDKNHVKSFSGSMFDNKNPMPKWIKQFDNRFGLKNQTYNFYKMETFEVMPPHSDHYNTYARLFNVDRSKVYRVIVMLEDWKPGHYFELDGRGYSNWRAGDYFMWNNDVPHAAANIGNLPRYTLQVTGEIDESLRDLSFNKSHIRNLYYFDRNVVPDFDNAESEILLKSLIEKTGIKGPCFIFMGCGPISELVNFIHEKEINSVHIFLWEPLSTYITDKGYSSVYYSEYSFDTNPSLIRADELDSIEMYMKNNNLIKGQVTVHTCHYNVDRFFEHYDSLILKTNDLFLKTYSRFVNTQFNHKTFFKTTFLCTTWRYTKHRHLITAYIASHLDADYNWFYRCDLKTLETNLFFDLRDLKLKDDWKYYWITCGVDKLNDETPISLDIEVDKPTDVTLSPVSFFPNTEMYSGKTTPAIDNAISQKFENLYENVFCIVVCETRFAEHCGYFSEKVYQAIQMKRPFILVAPPLSLEYFKSLGFKSFSEFWDESYDTETDHMLRLIKIFNLLESINKMTHDEKIEMNNKMFKVLYHNFKLLWNNTQVGLHPPGHGLN